MNSSPSGHTPDAGHTGRWSLAPHLPLRRDARRVLIAVATADGTRVDGNFEDSEAFLLYEKDGGRTCFVGRQPCPMASGGGETRRTRLLADCDLVLCTNISDACKQMLSELSIGCNLAYAGAMIGDAVSALARDNAN